MQDLDHQQYENSLKHAVIPFVRLALLGLRPAERILVRYGSVTLFKGNYRLGV